MRRAPGATPPPASSPSRPGRRLRRPTARPLPLAAELERRLSELEEEGLGRSLCLPSGLDFCSNDYLGLAQDLEFRREVLGRLAALDPAAPLSAPASRLLRGHTSLHERLEDRLARFKGTEAALLFASGYQANLGLLTALAGPGDRALSDAQNHASIIDGLRLSGCHRVVFPHLSCAAVARELSRRGEAAVHLTSQGARSPRPGEDGEQARRPEAVQGSLQPAGAAGREKRAGRLFLVTESLFSMDGDIAPLDRYARLAEEHGADLIVDDAHATGLFGEERGSGLCEAFGVERKVAASVSTLGKALGLSGAFVAGPRVLIDYLVSRCRPFVFSTAVPPIMLHALEVALDLLASQPARGRRALALADRLRRQLAAGGFPCGAGRGPIVPVVLGDNRRALAVAARLQGAGFDVRAVRPPTVPRGTARLRISLHADHRESEVDALAAALLAAQAAFPAALPLAAE